MSQTMFNSILYSDWGGNVKYLNPPKFLVGDTVIIRFGNEHERQGFLSRISNIYGETERYYYIAERVGNIFIEPTANSTGHKTVLTKLLLTEKTIVPICIDTL
jgi:hypothetical protein